MYYRRSEPIPSTMAEVTPNRGPSTDPNPGELSTRDVEMGAPLNSLGIIPSRGNRAGGGAHIDVGAMVGIMRNLEFTAGGRAHRLSTGTTSPAAPAYDPKTDRLHTSSASDTGEPSVGGAEGQEGQPAMAPHVEGAGATNDTTTGRNDPGRRRDTRTP